MIAEEGWTDTARGTSMRFKTTDTGTATDTERMRIAPNGDVGIGTSSPTGALEIVRSTGAHGDVFLTGYSDTFSLTFRTATGTEMSPGPTSLGTFLGQLSFTGHGVSAFGDGGILSGKASEDWTDAAHGAGLAFFTTANGQTATTLKMSLTDSGSLGIGTSISNGLNTALDKLHVAGDIRVGTGTTGCVKDANGTVIAGTCSSDFRLKRDITPFGPTLQALTSLQPVHYFWRSDEFPKRHFGTNRTYGLVAQDVEQVLPELVVTDDEGYKAVDYSKLPLLTIQAMKELKAENDALKARVVELETLKQRMADLEKRLVELAATRR
jgi:hypothetical protein